MGRILVAVTPLAGHVNPMLLVAESLRRHGQWSWRSGISPKCSETTKISASSRSSDVIAIVALN
jgi:hypothetical protein